MKRPTRYLDPKRSVNPIKDEEEKESPTSQVMSTPATSDFKTEDETEIQEEFCAVMERIKSEEMESGDTKPVVSDEDCEAKRSEQSPEPIPQLSNDASLVLRCRLCAIQNGDMVDIFGSEGRDIPEMIKGCLPNIVVKETDTLPKQACRDCLDRLQLCYQFNQIVAEAENQLLALLRGAVIKPDGRDENCRSSSGAVRCNATVHPEIEDRHSCEVMQNAEPLVTVEKGLPITRTVTSRPGLTHCSVVLVAIDNNTQTRSLRSNVCKKDGRRRPSDDRRNHTNPSIKDSHSEKRLSDVYSPSTSESEVSGVTRSGSQAHKKNLLKTLRGKEIEDLKVNAKTLLINKTSDAHRRVNDLPIANPVIEAPTYIGKRVYNCRKCGKKYSSKASLSEHSRLHTGERLHTCQYCEKKFISRSHRDKHQRVHSEERPFKCSFCEKSYKSVAAMRDHAFIHRKHEDSAGYRCSICHKAFKFKSQLNGHAMMHSSEERWQCDYCKKGFTRKTTLRNHVSSCEERTDIGKQYHKCNLCAKSFKWRNSLRQHYQLHTGKNLYSCEYCKKNFTSISQRDRHLIVHTDDQSYKCATCDKSFKYYSDMKRHSESHISNRPRPQCDNCKKFFSLKNSLLRHSGICQKRYE